MMLEKILHKYCALGGDAFGTGGDLTEEGLQAYDWLIRFVYDLGMMCESVDSEKVVAELDSIASSKEY